VYVFLTLHTTSRVWDKTGVLRQLQTEILKGQLRFLCHEMTEQGLGNVCLTEKFGGMPTQGRQWWITCRMPFLLGWTEHDYIGLSLVNVNS